MRLVDADELMIKFEAAQKEAARHGREFASCFYDHGGEVSTNWYCVEDMVDNAPTVDAAPVRHGRWIKPTGMMPPEHSGHYECSLCGAWAMRPWLKFWKGAILTKRCPECGALMDVKEGDENGEVR